MIGAAQKQSLNITKSKYMILKPGSKKINLTNQTIQINKTTLTRVGTNCQKNQSNFFDYIIDDDLKWTDHIKNVNRKI